MVLKRTQIFRRLSAYRYNKPATKTIDYIMMANAQQQA